MAFEYMNQTRMERQLRRRDDLVRRLFDREYYESQVLEEFETLEAAWDHYEAEGAKHRVSPHPLFDAAYYNRLYPDVQHVDDLFTHFLGSGDLENRIPHALFDREHFRSRHESTSCAGASSWVHYLSCDTGIECTPLWQPIWSSDADRLTHRDSMLAYLRGNSPTGLVTPHPAFDPNYFRMHQQRDPAPDLLRYASRLGDERESVTPNLFFDQGWYLRECMSDAEWFESPLSHYLKAQGSDEPTDFSPFVKTEQWVETGLTVPGLTDLMLESRYSEPAGATESAGIDVLVINIDSAAMTTLACVLARVAGQAERMRFHVLDNGSSRRHEAAVLSSYLPWACVGRSQHRRSFGEGNNLLFERGSAPLVLLLNSDAFVIGAALERLVRALRDTRAVGVGPCFVFPDGTIQEVGGVIAPDGTPVQLAKYLPQVPRQLRERREVDYISAACFLVTREAYASVGGFDFRYEPAYYEDTDLCWRLGAIGALVVEPDARVMHFEGFTTGREEILADKPAIQALSREKFLTAFAGGRPAPMAATPPAAVTRESPTAVLYSPYGLMMGGGERYFLSMAAVIAHEYRTALAFDGPYSHLRLHNIQASLGLESRDFDLIDLSSRGATLPAAELGVVMGNSLVPPVQAAAKANLYMCQFPFPNDDDRFWESAERLRRWDGVVVNSAFTRDQYTRKMAALGASVPVHVVHPPCELTTGVAPLGAGNGPLQILHVGRFFEEGHSKRQDVAVRALKHLLDLDVEAELHLVGGVAADVGSRLYFKRVRDMAKGLPVSFHPDASRDRLMELLRSADFYWHTTGVGVPQDEPERLEHFGIAVVEAMSAGCVPVVLDRGGPAGVVSHLSERLLVSGRPGEYAAVTADLAFDVERQRDLRAAAIDAATRFSDEAFVESFAAVVLESVRSSQRRGVLESAALF